MNGESTSMVWPTLGSRTAKEHNRTVSYLKVKVLYCVAYPMRSVGGVLGCSSLFCRPWAHRWLDHWSINLSNACVSSWILFTACLHKLRCQIWFCSWPDRNWWHITAKWEDCIIIYSHASIDMDSEPLDGYITEVCDTWLVTYYYLPSPGAFGICMWTTWLRLLPESGMARTQTRDLLSRESNTLTTASPGHAY